MMVMSKLRNLKNKRETMNSFEDRNSTRKIAGKHISIILNTNNTEEGEDIDIKISNRKPSLKVQKQTLESEKAAKDKIMDTSLLIRSL